MDTCMKRMGMAFSIRIIDLYGVDMTYMWSLVKDMVHMDNKRGKCPWEVPLEEI